MLQVQNLTKAYGDQVVLDDVTFLMTPRERLGLVGRNGSGKTTLFRMLLGEEEPDLGEIVMPRGHRIGHLSQHLVFEQPTILDEVAHVLGDRVDTERYRAEAALMGLGFTKDDLARPAREFSGGFQIRVNLARVLVEEPHLLLLDEPTNYLDIVALRWLERFLRAWPHELIVISHDRRFLDLVTTHTMVVHRRKLRRMEGNVDKLLGQIATEEEIHESTRLNEDKKRRRDERFVERFRAKATKARAVQSRVKALEKRGRMEALETEAELRFRFKPAQFHASTLMRVEGLRFGFDDGPDLIEGLDLELEHGECLAVIGPNGRGKTTLLNLLAGELTPRAGTVKPHPALKPALFGQTNIDRLHPEMTVEQELTAAHPEGGRKEVRGLCGLLMFSGEAAEKPVKVLSGGERSRVLLGKLLVSPANLLLLDEPTNHLDLESVEGLVSAVEDFPGGVVLVTHSEMILERLATRLVVFDGGRVFTFQGGYRDFLDRVGWVDEGDEVSSSRAGGRGASTSSAGAAAPVRSGPRLSGKDARRRRAEIVKARSRATSDLRRQLERAEADIERLESEVTAHDAAMVEAAEQGRAEVLAEEAAAAKRKRDEIEALFERLETLTEELEAASADFDRQLAELE